MTGLKVLRSVLINSVGLLVLAGGANAQSTETVVVTGSRIITNGNASPTPVTVVTTGQLAELTPSNVPDGLNTLPVFAQSTSQRNPSGSTSNGAGNFLNLRGFGVQRTLILLDGNRVPATAQNGTVNVDTLPQMLMSRVDVVTGGASAVYGSDAVTGVVNFVLDKQFTGLKTEVQAGVSSRGDDMSWKAGLAWGKNMFGGRGHLEMMFEHYNSDGINNMNARSLGPLVYTEAGTGSAATPYYLAVNTRYIQETPGGYIPSGPLANMYFPSTGVIAPFTGGTPLNGNAGSYSGGDGGYSGEAPADCYQCNQYLIATLHTNQAFARFDYSLSPSVQTYLQASWAQSYNFNTFFSQWFNQKVPSTNAFLPASAAAALVAAKATSFTLERQFEDYPQWSGRAFTQNITGTIGFKGTLFDTFDWDLHYTYGGSSLNDSNTHNTNIQRLTAALDAVVAPSGPNAGQVVCAVSLTSFASAYQGCIPLNPFGPNAPSAAAVAWVDGATPMHQYNSIQDFAGSLSGTLFQGWAGPIKAALSGEYRYFTLVTKSTFDPAAKVDCTGLNVNSCSNTLGLWGQAIVGPMSAKENVWEGALETDIPLLKDLPLVQAFDINAAARFTQYSISGSALTWKIGGVWNVTEDLEVRATHSRDIRAPTLYDLYSPATTSNTGFQDLLTGFTANTRTSSQGNTGLKAERSLTTTLGFVYSPGWLENFSAAVDMFQIGIGNAITSINGTTPAIQNLCNSSNGTSPYCALYVRGYAFGSPLYTAPAAYPAGNYPIAVLSESLNVAKTSTHGIDGEVNYRFDLANLDPEDLEGTLSTRLLLTYQPSLITNTGIPGAVITNAAGAVPQAANRVTISFGYTDGPFSVNAQERWHSGERQNSNPALIFLTPAVPSIGYVDLSFNYKFKLRDRDKDEAAQAFLSIQNLLDQQPHVWIPTGFTSAPGFRYPAPFDEDVVGRYVTAGFKYHL